MPSADGHFGPSRWLGDTDDHSKWWAANDFLFTFINKQDSISFGFRDTEDVSTKFWPLRVIDGFHFQRGVSCECSAVTIALRRTVYTIQPVVQPVAQPVVQPSLYNQQPVEQPAASCKQTSNRLSKTGFTTDWMFVYTMQPVVQPVVQPVSQPVVSCKGGTRRTVFELWARQWVTNGEAGKRGRQLCLKGTFTLRADMRVSARTRAYPL